MNSHPSAKRRALIAALAVLPLDVRARTIAGDVRLDYGKKHQVIEGFGTCMVTWDTEFSAAYRSGDFAKLYLETLGASVLRVELWGGAAPAARERWQDITWRDFRLDASRGRGQVSVDVAKKLHAASGGDIRIIATAWSPPAWMKVNESLGNVHPQRKSYAINFDHAVERGEWNAPLATPDGEERYRYVGRNKLRPDRFLHFAKSLVEWVRCYRALGIPLYAISPANEPRFSHWFESCVHTPEEYSRLLEAIAWMFENQGEPLPVFGPEHMTRDIAGNRLYLEAVTQRPAALRGLAAIASHGYIDGYAGDTSRESPAAFGRFAAPYGKKVWVTEGGFGKHDWPKPLHELAASFLYALRDGGVSLLTTWQTLTGVPPDEHGLVTLRGPTKKTYAAMQFWRFIRPGMVRISVDAAGGLEGVAFEDSRAGKTALVLLNRSRRNVSVSLRATDRRVLAVESMFVTDALRDFERMGVRDGPRAIDVSPETVATLVLRTKSLS